MDNKRLTTRDKKNSIIFGITLFYVMLFSTCNVLDMPEIQTPHSYGKVSIHFTGGGRITTNGADSAAFN